MRGHVDRQPADRGPLGAARGPRRRRSTGSAGCSAPPAGCCRWRSRRSTSPPRCAALDPDRPDALTTVRGQVEVATTDGVITSIALDPTDPAACPEAVAGDPRRRLGRARPGLVVQLGDPAPDGPGAARGPGRDRRAPGRRAQPRRRRPGRPAASRPRTTSPSWRARPRPRGPHGAGRPARSRAPTPSLRGSAVGACGARLVVADVAAGRRHRRATTRQARGERSRAERPSRREGD